MENQTEYNLPLVDPKYNIKFITMDEWLNTDINNIALNDNFIYAGSVENVNEILAEKIVDKTLSGLYKNYKPSIVYSFHTAKQSFQTLSKLPKCIISEL